MWYDSTMISYFFYWFDLEKIIKNSNKTLLNEIWSLMIMILNANFYIKLLINKILWFIENKDRNIKIFKTK